METRNIEKSYLPTRLATFVQFCITATLGASTGYALLESGENSKVALLGAMVVGFGGNWVINFLYIWAKFDLKAARSMKIYGD